MTQDEIIRMAREAGLSIELAVSGSLPLERFAALVAEATKKKAAKVCEAYGDAADEAYQENDSEFDAGECNGAYGCAAAIRSMK